MDDMPVADEGVRRRLPSWMLGDQARSKSEALNVNDGDSVKECNENEENVGRRGRKVKPRVQKKGNGNGNVSLKQPSSTVLVRGQERNPGRREVTTGDTEINLDDEFYEEAPKKKRKSSIKGKTCLEVETVKDVESGSQDGESDDLTVEDLVSIAKEYVEEDNKGRVKVSSKQRDIAGNESRDISCSITDTNVGSFDNQGTSSSNMAENSTSDTGPKPAVSGNTTDMLELLLGPLYKKTRDQEKEKRLNLEYASFKYEEKKQGSSVDVGEEPIAVVKKKKSSLKDMVAMYLN